MWKFQLTLVVEIMVKHLAPQLLPRNLDLLLLSRQSLPVLTLTPVTCDHKGLCSPLRFSVLEPDVVFVGTHFLSEFLITFTDV